MIDAITTALSVTPQTLIIAAIIMFIGSLTQGLIGFGLAVVASPLLYLVDPALVPGPVIIVGFSISLLTLIRERGHLDFNGLQYALLGRIPGGFLGSSLLLFAPQAILGLAISAIVSLAVILNLRKFSVEVNRRNLFIAGVFSGIFGNIAAIGGPPLALLLANNKEAGQFRAALSAFFIFSSMIAMLILIVMGLFGFNDLYLGLLMLPSVLLSHKVAGRLVHKIDKQKTRVMTLILCSLSALILAAKSLFALTTQ